MKRGTKRNDIKFAAGNGQRAYRHRTLIDWLLSGLTIAEGIEEQKRRQHRSWFQREYHSHETTYHRPNGTAECARRRRQIAKGQLTESNGLARGIQW